MILLNVYVCYVLITIITSIVSYTINIVHIKTAQIYAINPLIQLYLHMQI